MEYDLQNTLYERQSRLRKDVVSWVLTKETSKDLDLWFSSRKYRGSGRTYLIAVVYINLMLNNRGKVYILKDHAGNKGVWALGRQVESLMKRLGLKDKFEVRSTEYSCRVRLK